MLTFNNGFYYLQDYLFEKQETQLVDKQEDKIDTQWSEMLCKTYH